MTVTGTTLEITRRSVPPFLTDDAHMVGEPATNCVQQLWCSPRAVVSSVHANASEGWVGETSCLRQLGLRPGFTPMVD
jgi:hypothetical protein